MQQNPQNITAAREGVAELRRLSASVKYALDGRAVAREQGNWHYRQDELIRAREQLATIEAIAAELAQSLGTYGAVFGAEYERFKKVASR